MALRILIIEDNPASLDLISYLLRMAKHEVFQARDGAEGLSMARSLHPDLIVCDIQLPVLDGYAVAAELAEDPSLRGIPRLAVTALAMVGDRDRVLARGFHGYLSKPINPRTFVQEIEKLACTGPGSDPVALKEG